MKPYFLQAIETLLIAVLVVSNIFISAVPALAQPSLIRESAQTRSFLSVPGTTEILAQSGQSDWEPPKRKTSSDDFWSWLRGLGRRGPCSNLNPPLIALMPSLPDAPLPQGTHSGNNAEDDSKTIIGAERGVALTASAHPTFWVYIPDELGNNETADSLELMIQDTNSEDLLKKPLVFQLTATGIVGIQLPETAPALKVGQPYHWYVSAICDRNRPSRNPHVDAGVERVSAEALGLADLLGENSTPLQQIQYYSDADIWHETVELVLSNYCTNPSNPVFRQYWQTILDVSLSDVENAGQQLYCSEEHRLPLASEQLTPISYQ